MGERLTAALLIVTGSGKVLTLTSLVCLSGKGVGVLDYGSLYLQFPETVCAARLEVCHLCRISGEFCITVIVCTVLNLLAVSPYKKRL